MEKQTVAYYDSHARSYSSTSKDVDIHDIQNKFLSFLKDGDRILDLGCGVGRDSRYFLDRGYDVEAVDGSEEMCISAYELLKIDVRNLYFEELDYIDEFDGIWSCASLLHVPSSELPNILEKCFAALKKGGVFYMSFKTGDFEGERDGRYYTDMTEKRMRKMLSSLHAENEVKEIFVTEDSLDRGNGWLNVIVKKI